MPFLICHLLLTIFVTVRAIFSYVFSIVAFFPYVSFGVWQTSLNPTSCYSLAGVT